jgi:hypothetical protein
MENLNCPALLPVETPVGLTYLDSDLFWCVEIDEDGEHVLPHRQVIWNSIHNMRRLKIMTGQNLFG